MRDNEIKEIIDTLKIAKAEIEWNYPLNYQIIFDKAIKIIEKRLPKAVSKSYDDRHDYLCPACRMMIGERMEWNGEEIQAIPPFCKFCGQRVV